MPGTATFYSKTGRATTLADELAILEQF